MAHNALVLPHFDYCCDVWDTINFTLCDGLQTISEGRAQFVASQMYKITHDLAHKP